MEVLGTCMYTFTDKRSLSRASENTIEAKYVPRIKGKLASPNGEGSEIQYGPKLKTEKP